MTRIAAWVTSDTPNAENGRGGEWGGLTRQYGRSRRLRAAPADTASGRRAASLSATEDA
jgi:hypothetical protein